jgi:DNA-binding IclR family transcriptional regulator
MRKRKTKTIKSLEKTLDIIEVLHEVDSAGVSEIAERAGVPSSTTYMHLNTLAQRRYVVNDGTDYRLSFRFLEHGGAARQQLDFFSIVKEEVTNISRILGEIVGFAVEEEEQRVILYRSEGQEAVGDQIPVGEHTHLHWTSLGKAILAHLPVRRVDEIVAQHGLPAGTENTITSRTELREELQTIRSVGYAVDNSERRRGIRGIAVPIKNGDEDVVGSIGVAGPKARYDPSYLSQILDFLDEERNIIEVRNGFYR